MAKIKNFGVIILFTDKMYRNLMIFGIGTLIYPIKLMGQKRTENQY